MDNNEAIGRIKFLLDVGGSDGFTSRDKEALNMAIDALSTWRRHGYWIQQQSPYGRHFNCSECGHEFTVPCSELIDPRDYVCYLDDYCGKCGAKMDGGVDNG